MRSIAAPTESAFQSLLRFALVARSKATKAFRPMFSSFFFPLHIARRRDGGTIRDRARQSVSHSVGRPRVPVSITIAREENFPALRSVGGAARRSWTRSEFSLARKQGREPDCESEPEGF
ncbi:hypothetical protein Mapa_002465 [Marchantia paleacea]|nr:hypothetical protein Mapa_002465 [Marchantia paleacea]